MIFQHKCSFLWIIILFSSMYPLNSQIQYQQSDDIDPRVYCSSYDIHTPDAVTCYQRIMEENPNSPKSHYFLAIAYIYNNDQVSTKVEFNALSKINPQYNSLLLDVIFHVKPEWVDDFNEEANTLKELR